MPSDDLTKWITSEVDFYTLLGITPESFTAEELRRAYRKTALRYHPDKLGDAFDPDKYEQFQAANDVLADPELKQKYDNYRNARVQKQRAAALFEGKRRAMKEDLEARERGGSLGKRSREDEEMDAEIKRLAEEGRKRRAKRQSMMAENVSSPTFAPPPQAQSRPQSSASATSNPPPSAQTRTKEQEEAQEDEVARLERLIAEAAAAKAKRKADKKARKSSIYNPPQSPAPNATSSFTTTTKENRERIETPIKRPDIFNGLKADSKSASTSASSPKFSFSPNAGKKIGGVSDFAATMERLKEAERKRLEGEIREREAREV
ncbi:hypothetical protein EYC80_009125 [Monilinia laxa]|uniref:J domain-containing protein n=1 Tax=Monilinia laxa TaxID=61186 RepID=A0A5N6K2H7_MONLA|nr:hypothetical protein EYC80_009125 [Monilinia laxa]